MQRKYYLGLDIGTDSVGYAVTDHEYNLIKFHGEPAWGVHLFDAANPASERRAFRTARRRLDRRQQRVELIRELFAKAIAEKDPKFYTRLRESMLYSEDKEERFCVFNDPNYTDREYHEQYPTIHHLIVDLMNSTQPRDARLVYLACAWLVAHRGHFLNEIDRDNVSRITDFTEVYASLNHYFIDNGYAVPWDNCDPAAFGAAVRMKASITRKYKALVTACFASGKAPKEPTEEFPFRCETILKAICGSRVEAKDIFANDEYAEVRSFSLGSDDETLAEVMGQLGEDARLIECLKAVYDWGLLVDILGASATISEAKVAQYDCHTADLRLLKDTIRKYCPNQFFKMFRDTKTADNYAAYAYHGDTAELGRKAKQEDFCKYVKKVLKDVKPDEADSARFADMMERVELGVFMPKQKTTDNRVIPYQLYWYELDTILKNAENYLPFLAERDSDGISVSDKIRSVFTFRVPYFVGPLNSHSEHAWIVREEGRIYPWNFEQKVDLDASENAFIQRMVGACTYLPGEIAVPKDSLLYHRYTVLNEINNIRVDDKPITPEAKQGIYNDVFLRFRKGSLKRVREWLIANGHANKDSIITGIDQTIKSNLNPQHDFKRLLESGQLTEEQAEQIIERRTYCEDRGRFRRWLNKHFAFLPAEDITYLSRLNYKDFGRLSRRLLTGIEAVIDPATGELTTIMGAMWDTNANLMELLSDNYDFKAQIDAERAEYYRAHPASIEDRLKEMYISSAVRRPIMRTLDIMEELTKAFGAPEKVFVEMARGGTPDQKGKRTQSRREQLYALYEKCADEDVRLVRGQLDDMGDSADTRLQSDKLFLYYIQLGRCAYTGTYIDLDQLMHSDSGRYNIEHIYPQSLVKDDSILNNEVLVDSRVNGEKSDSYPIAGSIRATMASFWKKLRDAGLMSEEKHKRLTRATAFSADEKWGFINRQLTETSQSTKAVASILKEFYPDTEVVYVKARLASEFRQEFDRIKSRLYNDLHHAKDAYLNIVAGNVYNMKFTRRWFNIDNSYSVKVKTIFTHPVVCGETVVWDGVPMLEKVKKNLTRNNIHLTRYAFTRQGGFFDQMPVKAAEGLIPRKAGLPTEKYGGYNRPAVTFFLLTRYKVGKKTDIMMMPVEMLRAAAIGNDPAAMEAYAKERIGSILGKIVSDVTFPLGLRRIKINSILSLDGFRTYISGTSNGGTQVKNTCFVAFVSDYSVERYIKRLEMYVEKLSMNPNHVYAAAFDKVTAEENTALYDLYVRKLETSVFGKRPNNPVGILKTGKEAFLKLDVAEQAKVLLNIHQIFGRMTSGCDLRSIKGSSLTGVTRVNSCLSNIKKMYTDVRIIDQSASGLWEKQSENLLDLL